MMHPEQITNLRYAHKVYESADCYHRKYDYELEYLDGKGNFSTTIHFVES